MVKNQKNSVLAKKMSCLEQGTQNLRESETSEKKKITIRFFAKRNSKCIKLSSVRIRVRIKVISWIRIRSRVDLQMTSQKCVEYETI
jgi:hypothetical protein